jgi:nucleoid-associated protein YgaU
MLIFINFNTKFTIMENQQSKHEKSNDPNVNKAFNLMEAIEASVKLKNKIILLLSVLCALLLFVVGMSFYADKNEDYQAERLQTAGIEEQSAMRAVIDSLESKLNQTLEALSSATDALHRTTQSENAESKKEAKGSSLHLVKKGESLWLIAKEHLGDAERYTEIIKLNNIKHPDLIYEGQKLEIKK